MIMSERVFIFDTTLRDGEQSCGCSMSVSEKIRLAHRLAAMGVDVIEAGFPMASEGDLEAVRRIGGRRGGHRARSRAQRGGPVGMAPAGLLRLHHGGGSCLKPCPF
jgi:2-isopropylmalate synthase